VHVPLPTHLIHPVRRLVDRVPPCFLIECVSCFLSQYHLVSALLSQGTESAHLCGMASWYCLPLFSRDLPVPQEVVWATMVSLRTFAVKLAISELRVCASSDCLTQVTSPPPVPRWPTHGHRWIFATNVRIMMFLTVPRSCTAERSSVLVGRSRKSLPCALRRPLHQT
jgi:hypothetical protein